MIFVKNYYLKKKMFSGNHFQDPIYRTSVFSVPSKINKIIDILQKVNGTGIVYCKSRKRTREISDLLLNMHGIVSDYYHAGLSQEQRNTKQESWLKDQTRIIVCTNAFGMGIDKPSVRIVVHADTPDCLENYYHRSRAGGEEMGTNLTLFCYINEEEINELKNLINARYPSLGLIL